MASKSINQESSKEDKQPSASAPRENVERETSIDSTQFFEAADEYDDYDDFGAASGNRMDKRQQDRRGGSGNVYSSKHVRAKESQQRSSKK